MYPKYVEVNGKRYAINTDFRVALKCDEIGRDETISIHERPLAIIYLLFGDDALQDYENHEQLLEMAKRYLSCDKEVKQDIKPDMDLTKDFGYIKASFRSDYSIDLTNEKMHWWEFCEYLNGLSNSEFGNCCVLNKIRNIRNADLSKIKDPEQRKIIEDAQKEFALEEPKRKREFTQEEKNNMNLFFKQIEGDTNV